MATSIKKVRQIRWLRYLRLSVHLLFLFFTDRKRRRIRFRKRVNNFEAVFVDKACEIFRVLACGIFHGKKVGVIG